MSYEKLSNDLKIHIQSYLEYESIHELSKTNHNNRNLYKSLEKNPIIPLISKHEYYIYRNYKDKIYNYFFSQLFVKVIDYNENVVSYQYISYGRDQNQFWPMKNIFLHLITHDITKPSYPSIIHISRNEFENKYKLYNYYWKDHLYFLFYMIIKSLCIYTFIYIPILSIFLFINIVYYLIIPIGTFMYMMLLLLLFIGYVEYTYNWVIYIHENYI